VGVDDLSCATDAVSGRPTSWTVDGLIGETVNVDLGERPGVHAVVAFSADEALRQALVAAGPPVGTHLAVVDPTAPAAPVVAATGTAVSRSDVVEDLGRAARDAAATAALPGGGTEIVVGEAGGRPYAARTLPGGPVVVALAAQPVPVSAPGLLVVLLVMAGVAALGAAALLASALTATMSRLAGVARTISDAGVDARVSSDLVSLSDVAEREVREVGTALGELVHGLRESEADVARARAAFVDAVGRFGTSLDRASRHDGLLRAVAEAALVSADARLAVVSVTRDHVDEPGRESPAPGTPAEPTDQTVAVFVAGGSAWSTQDRPPVLLNGDPDVIDLTDPDDLVAATAGMRLLRDLAAHAVATGRAVSAELPGEGSGVVVPMRGGRPAQVAEAGPLPARPPWQVRGQADGGLPGQAEGQAHAARRGSISGYVAVARDASDAPLDEASVQLVSTLAGHAGTALHNVRRHHRAARLSVTDPLTGIGNLRHLTSTLTREVERATRFGHPLSVLMIDIDRFKDVNDTHGHARGDLVLTDLARRMTRSVRDIDTVARYGGEEFCVLLPETGLDGAAVLARRILATVATEPFVAPAGPDLTLTVSIGVAAFPVHGRTGADVMRIADAALYAAKRAGRAQVVVAGADEGVRGTESPALAERSAVPPGAVDIPGQTRHQEDDTASRPLGHLG
jgi:diguanylate cyclase (GGDEF)-like protein